MPGQNKPALLWWMVTGLSAAIFLYGGYFLERHESYALVVTFTGLFCSYFYLLKNRRDVSLRQHFLAGLLVRLSLLAMIPNLSDDFYRFIWDGQLTWQGIHPFAELPSYYASQGDFPAGLNDGIYQNLNSPEYFTVYPPVSQFFFMVTVAITGGDIFWSAVALRVFLIAAESGTFFLLRNLSAQVGLDPRRISWYWLNPLVILEITGNLHFEGIMIFFCFISLLLIHSRQIWMAGAVFGLAVGVKLLPLIFLPVIWRHIGTREFLRFSLATSGVFLVFTLPFMDMDLLFGLSDSLALYFNKFEFNASVYYLVRTAGYWIKGYNIIGTAGPFLGFLTLASILLYTRFHSPEKTQLTTAMGISLTIYLMLATTVHPWYILILITFMSFQKMYYPVVWSLLIVVSYTGYSLTGYKEILWLTFMEYAVVIVYMGYEFFYAKRISNNPLYQATGR